MTANEILAELRALGSESTRRVLIGHGAPADPDKHFGVKVADLKTILKRTKVNHALALELWDTGNSDARYLAGLMCDPRRMDAGTLNHWAATADWSMLSEYTVAWVAAESPLGRECAMTWISSNAPNVAASGWSTYASVLAMLPSEKVDAAEVTGLIERIERDIASAPDRVRYAMNGFLIAVGTYEPTLRDVAESAARAIGKVKVNVGGTACKVPDAVETIAKSAPRASKRKAVRC